MTNDLIVAQGVHFSYDGSSKVEALCGVDLRVRRGEYLVILGRNGSGKSTLAKCLNGLLIPDRGDVYVNGINTRHSEAGYAVRAMVGIVLQNPDNQFVATTVEEEVAFGPENLGLPCEELRSRVDEALALTGLLGLRQRSVRYLSAGEKARLAVAGILAMRPQCLILDESTAMLDPGARCELLRVVRGLHEQGMTIIAITHAMAEVPEAQRAVVLEAGKVAFEGTPVELFTSNDALHQLSLQPPPVASIVEGLRRRGLGLSRDILTGPDLVRALAVYGETRA